MDSNHMEVELHWKNRIDNRWQQWKSNKYVKRYTVTTRQYILHANLSSTSPTKRLLEFSANQHLVICLLHEVRCQEQQQIHRD